MLSTGIFDDLAHIITEFYQLIVRKRTDVSLQIPQGNKPTRFYETLKPKNADLHRLLTAEETQREINAFYPIRDSLIHRELLKGVHYGLFPGGKNLFELSDEAVESLGTVSGTSTYIVRLHKPCLDPLFVTWAQKMLIRLVNDVLSSMSWNSMCETLPADVQSEISESNREFEQGVGRFLGWQAEPLYF